jgi:hypothetical protein
VSTLGSVLGTLSDLAAIALAGPAPLVRGGVAGDVVRVLGAAAGVAGKLATDGVSASDIVEKIRRVLPLDERVRAQDAAIADEIDRRFPPAREDEATAEIATPTRSVR